MSWMNECDIESALAMVQQRQIKDANFGHAVRRVAKLMEWTNANSDGWAYWRSAQRAGDQLCSLVTSRVNQFHISGRFDRYVEPISDKELTRATTPLKRFLTRQGTTFEEMMK